MVIHAVDIAHAATELVLKATHHIEETYASDEHRADMLMYVTLIQEWTMLRADGEYGLRRIKCSTVLREIFDAAERERRGADG